MLGRKSLIVVMWTLQILRWCKLTLLPRAEYLGFYALNILCSQGYFRSIVMVIFFPGNYQFSSYMFSFFHLDFIESEMKEVFFTSFLVGDLINDA